MKQISTFDGKKADDFLERSFKLRANLSIYTRAIFDFIQRQERPSVTDESQATARAAWDAVNQDPFSILLLSMGGSAFFFVRRLREGIRAEHVKMNNTPILREQDPDEYIYILDSCRDRLGACDPPESPTDRQYEDIILQALPPQYKVIRQVHLEREDFGLADIRRMMADIYADTLARSRYDALRGIAGCGSAMPAMTRDRSDIKCHFGGRVDHFKEVSPTLQAPPTG